VNARAVSLVCPLCRAVVVEGAEPAGGRCPGCGATYAGGGDDARGGVAAALEGWGITDLDAGRAADGLFRLLPDDPLGARVTVTSDRRDGFYRWWVFVAAGDDPATVLAQAAERAA
jgi:hypothetical protein